MHLATGIQEMVLRINHTEVALTFLLLTRMCKQILMKDLVKGLLTLLQVSFQFALITLSLVEGTSREVLGSVLECCRLKCV